MTTAARKPMSPWLAALIGILVLFVLTGLLSPDAHAGIIALAILIATAIGAYAAARLSRRTWPGWVVGAAGLLSAIGYLYLQSVESGSAASASPGLAFRQTAVPLWLMASLLGSPLLGARLGIGAATR